MPGVRAGRAGVRRTASDARRGRRAQRRPAGRRQRDRRPRDPGAPPPDGDGPHGGPPRTANDRAVSAHPGHRRGVGRREAAYLWSSQHRLGKVGRRASRCSEEAPSREGPCGIGCSSTSSWVRLLTLLGRPKTEGLENVPESGPAILASNHLAVADSFYKPLVVTRRITFLAKAEYFTGTGIKGWFQRWFYTAAGQVPIDRTDADAAQARYHRRGCWARQAAGHVPRGHPLAGRPAVQGQDRAGAAGAGDRRAGHSGRDDRYRHRQPAGQQDVAVRPGHGQGRQADGLLPVRGTGRQHRAARSGGRDRRAGVPRHGRNHRAGGRARRGHGRWPAVEPAAAAAGPAPDGAPVVHPRPRRARDAEGALQAAAGRSAQGYRRRLADRFSAPPPRDR